RARPRRVLGRRGRARAGRRSLRLPARRAAIRGDGRPRRGGGLEPDPPLALRRPDPLEGMTKASPPHSASPAKWRAFLRARFTREGAVGLYMTVGFVAGVALVV